MVRVILTVHRNILHHVALSTVAISKNVVDLHGTVGEEAAKVMESAANGCTEVIGSCATPFGSLQRLGDQPDFTGFGGGVEVTGQDEIFPMRGDVLNQLHSPKITSVLPYVIQVGIDEIEGGSYVVVFDLD